MADNLSTFLISSINLLKADFNKCTGLCTVTHLSSGKGITAPYHLVFDLDKKGSRGVALQLNRWFLSPF